jgi:Flp pilus assembly protein TadG
MRRRFGKLRGGSTRERGQALVEFSLVIVVFLLFVFGILDMARLFQSWSNVQHAAREGARYGVTGLDDCNLGGTVTNDRAECVRRTVKNATTGMYNGGLNGTGVTVACQSWTYSSGYSAGSATGSGTCQTSTPASTGYLGSQCDAEEVKVTYNHRFITPLLQFAAPSGIDLVGRQRMINEPFGPC